MTTFHSLSVAIHRVLDSYQVELSHAIPESQAQIAPLHAPTSFNLDQLRALQGLPQDYGEALTRQLFCDPKAVQRFVKAETAAEASGHDLRLMVSIDPSAQELHSLRWELLHHPVSGAPLATSERLLFSRLIVSRDWRPVRLRARSELRALIAIAAPSPDSLAVMGLAAVDFEQELGLAKQVIDEIDATVVGGPDSPCTAKTLLDALHDGVDVLYLVCHGSLGRRTGAAALILEDEHGEAEAIRGKELALRMSELQRGPRLVILISCESAGVGEVSGSAHPTVAELLADAGVPGVIAMQGSISMTTVHEMMPTFFAELLRDGQIDRALAAARARVRDRPDAWMPALFTRLTRGCLWYTPGFRSERAREVWRQLVTPVANGKVVPIIGPRLLDDAHGDSHSIAEQLAGASRYPLLESDLDDLPRVTEYMCVKESRYNVIQAYQDQLLRDLIKQHRSWLPPVELPPAAKKPRLGKLLGLVGDHLREREHDAYRILAELPASVYVTTNFDPLLERALRANDRNPYQLLTRWRYHAAAASGIELPADPSPSEPLVYHVFGAFGTNTDDGLVLTEDDYFDYLIQTAESKLIPKEVESSLVDNSLLFLGFRLTDWHFRVLFRLMMSLPGRERLRQYCHVAVQLDPDLQTMADIDGAKKYLAEYFGKEANIDIFWGSSQEFLTELRKELAASGELASPDALGDDDDDDWCF